MERELQPFAARWATAPRIFGIVIPCLISLLHLNAAGASTISETVSPSGLATTIVHSEARISRGTPTPSFWWTLAASPANPEKLIACALQNDQTTASALHAVLFGSIDGGENWVPLFSDHSASLQSEVSCAVGWRDTIYFVDSTDPALPWQVMPEHERRALRRLRLRRSVDFGASWSETSIQAYLDSAILLVSPHGDSSQDSLVIFGDGKTRTLATSSDGGRTLRYREDVLPGIAGKRDPSWRVWTASAAPLDGGALGAVNLDPFQIDDDTKLPTRITLTRTHDDGTPIGDVVAVATLTDGWWRRLGKRSNFLTYRYPSVAAGRMVDGRHRAFIAWHDIVGGHVRILLSRSDDAGLHWSEPSVADDLPLDSQDLRGLAAAHASIAVSPDGKLGLMWGENAGRCWRFAVSRDGGMRFDSSVPLNRCRAGRRQNPLRQFDVAPEDSFAPPGVKIVIRDWSIYPPLMRGTSLVADAASGFHALWSEIGGPDDSLYVSNIRVAPSPLAGGVASLSTGRGRVLKGTVWMEYTRGEYLEAPEEFVLNAVLVHERQVEQHWPLILRVTDLQSPLGSLSIVGSDNDLTGKGAEWVFDGPGTMFPAASAAGLDYHVLAKKWEFSRPRTLHFRLERSTAAANSGPDWTFVSVGAEVFVPPPKE
jgi:hypothetical protein